MTDFLLELRSEEIPARMQVKAKDDLARLFAEEIAKAGLVAERIETFATPRRLALIARGLPDQTEAVSEERKGPRANAPEQALAGFLRSTGLARDQLVERDGVFFAVIEKPGQPTADVLATAIPAIIRAFPWPKSMRWGAASLGTDSLRWVRPLQGVVALLGQEIVPFAIDGIESGAQTVGHRFHHAGPITIGSAEDYVEKLRACHVIVHLSERQAIIRDGARAAAATEGLTLVEDDGLVLENAGLTEWPVPLLGRFDPEFLDVPREVIQLTMRTNQKYFACVDAGGALANAFICTANIDATDPSAIVAGNRKVLAARLSDAKFFWETDLKIPLEVQAEKLKDIVFHEKLGTVADKVDRVAKLARWLVETGVIPAKSDAIPANVDVIPAKAGIPPANSTPQPPEVPAFAGMTMTLADMAERAARLCKADLVTGMVGEFPELQGIIGGHLARAQGEPDAIADAIRDHYKPVGQGDEVPTAPVTVAVSLADKLDTLVAFFFADMPPTGSKDPFALRRAALGVLELLTRNGLRLSMWESITRGLSGMTDLKMSRNTAEPAFEAHKQAMQSTFSSLPDFFADRLKVQQREAGIRHDLIDAVFALGGEDDLVRLLARVKALQAFVSTSDGTNLLAGYKRAANILKKEGRTTDVAPAKAGASVGDTGVAPAKAGASGDDAPPSTQEAPASAGATHFPLSYTPEPAETALILALDSAEPLAAAAIEREDFEGAMTALASLRAPIDAFFETVIVNDFEPQKRDARLALLARVRDAVHRVADFSRIEG